LKGKAGLLDLDPSLDTYVIAPGGGKGNCNSNSYNYHCHYHYHS